MKFLLAIKSCKADWDRWYHSVIRNTYAQDIVNADLRFFMGGDIDPSMIHNDEVLLEVPDDYNSLSQKTKAIMQWALDRGYDFVFLCDTDTYLIPSKLATCGFEKYDYMGLIRRPLGIPFPYKAVDREGKIHFYESVYPWASGGYGYFVSRKAMEEIVKHKPNLWAEDMWVSQILSPLYNRGEIKIFDAHNFENEISWHFPAGLYKSGYDLKFNWLDDMYLRYR